MSKTIKQNLFRFVTLRNPQLIDNKEDHPGFVYHPNEKSSAFFVAIDGVKEADKQQVLEATAKGFTAFKTRKETRAYNEKLYRFSSWLMRNKNNLSFATIQANLNGALPLNPEKKEDLHIWENLIYQTVTKESVYVREALIQLLIANQFLLAFNKFSQGIKGIITFTDDQEKIFTRRANASVVISKSLFSNVEVSNEKPRSISSSDLKRLEDLNDVAIARYETANLETLLEDLKLAEVKYNKDNQKAYEAKLSEHNKTVEKIFTEVKPVIVEETDPKTSEVTRTETYPGLVLPKFDFVKEEAITAKYLEGKINDASLAVFNKENLGIYDTFEEVYKTLKTKIKNNNQEVFSKAQKAPKKARIGGVSMQLSNNKVPVLDYNIPNLMEINPSGLVSPFVVFYNVVQPLQISSMTYTVTLANGSKTTETNFDLIPTSDNMIRLFPQGTDVITGIENYTLSGEITLLSGEKYSFSQLVNRKSRLNMGLFKAVDVVTGTQDDSQICGVTNLGIADFRRVEQEVCCYVPGEVSHIENIMAREYKERSTRSLNSVETSTEQTTEREVENLTDTTTTERNEMQSEVASVINEDKSKNYGANASVSGEKFGIQFGAGAYFDAASSSSTSNSNSQAQTYAQEVTERAMERIVQKVSTKRTSRILKEFEENNKHGFDNTKGDKHVTGVYRWIDKIYKNKLINYGKRLMYEFAIPEPARFLKEALVKKVDNNQLDSGVILPTEPEELSTIGLVSAASINESNYQNFASKYGAEVNAPIDQYLKIGKAFVKEDQVYNSQGYAFNEIDVPEGYHATSGTVNWSVVAEVNSNRKLSIALGDSRHTVIGGSGSTSFYNFSDMYKKNIPFSFHAWYIHSGHFSVTLNCARTDQEYKQWQNETYTAIVDAYNDRLREYNEAIVASEVNPVGEDEKLKFNPAFNRSLEKKELKRLAIELLTRPFNVNTSANNYNTLTSPEIIKTGTSLKTHTATVKFFEQAFDWDIMAYILYPYFYADKEDWKDLFQETDAADPVFQAFLQSGMARTVVPIRPGFEDAVNWYMSTGELWEGQGLVTDQDDDLYVSIAEEMQTVEGEVEGTWETRLPTSLTIIQADAIGLDVEGLPCNIDCDDFALFDSDGNPELDAEGNPITNNPITKKEVLLGVSAPATTA